MDTPFEQLDLERQRILAYDKDVTDQLKRIKEQERQLEDFLDIRMEEAQCAILRYARLRATVVADRARLTARKEELKALQDEDSVVKNAGPSYLLNQVPLRTVNPSTDLKWQTGVSDNTDRELHFGVMNPSDSRFALSFVRLAEEIKRQYAIILTEKDTRPISHDQPPATDLEIAEFDALNKAEGKPIECSNAPHFRRSSNTCKRKKVSASSRSSSGSLAKISKRNREEKKKLQKALRNVAARWALHLEQSIEKPHNQVMTDDEIEEGPDGGLAESLSFLPKGESTDDQTFSGLAFRPK
ncbi:uncharacterized protein RCC_08856 [Ramularia collo-cygni]|uniref:Uncharacterized protein n=1 Tax=Ramularia collo-cygni TaxID=112498 RepID=A0A2D3V176_9PEZI|nr:uncharacterized protein RCC_08856 [Ramularia collo-cygni]CZT23146.1 uncharacterized protein RCC_08856 [Ramularia collo-cygni]